MVLESSGYVEGLWDEAEILFMASSVGQQRRKGDRDRDGAKKIKIAHLRSEAGTHSISQSGLDHLSRPGPRVQTVSTRRRVHSIHSIGEDKIFRNC